jgi:hypothetical protein
VKNYNIAAKKRAGRWCSCARSCPVPRTTATASRWRSWPDVPERIIAKAREYLRELENTGVVAPKAPAGGGDSQVSLEDVGSDEVGRILRDTDLNTITP